MNDYLWQLVAWLDAGLQIPGVSKLAVDIGISVMVAGVLGLGRIAWRLLRHQDPRDHAEVRPPRTPVARTLKTPAPPEPFARGTPPAVPAVTRKPKPASTSFHLNALITRPFLDGLEEPGFVIKNAEALMSHHHYDYDFKMLFASGDSGWYAQFVVPAYLEPDAMLAHIGETVHELFRMKRRELAINGLMLPVKNPDMVKAKMADHMALHMPDIWAREIVRHMESQSISKNLWS